jgi:MscS family membrane protein
VYGLVAGAGVGGLGIALAARSSLENFLGTFNLYADRPVRVGDFCRYGEDPSSGWLRIGTVEEIGLRSTRIRGIDRTITTIPNAEFANMHIVNLTRRDRMLFRTTIGLRYETTPNQLRQVLAKLRELLLAHPRVTKDPARVRATGFGAYSLDLEMFAYVNTSDWNDYLAVQEDLVLRTMDIVDKAGTAFAFPSRTLYHTRDPGLDSERQQVAEKEVREWASAHTLPFPEFDNDYRKQITDTLDYPPEGSPDADRG